MIAGPRLAVASRVGVKARGALAFHPSQPRALHL